MATNTTKKPRRKRSGKRKKKTSGSLRAWWRKTWRKSRPWVIGAFVLLVCYLLVPYVQDIFFAGHSSNAQYDGIDVSKHNGNINWQRVAQDPNIKFVYIKATEGFSIVDSKYKKNLREARAAGLKVGSYHFFRGYRTAEEQFAIFSQNVDKSQQDLVPMVDVEQTGNSLVKRDLLQVRLQKFMELVKEHYGKYPLLYSQHHFYNERLAPEFNKYFIFMARYSKKEPELKGGGKYNIWQYSEKGHIKGIHGNVDLDRFGPGTRLSDIEL